MQPEKSEVSKETEVGLCRDVIALVADFNKCACGPRRMSSSNIDKEFCEMGPSRDTSLLENASRLIDSIDFGHFD